MSVYVRHVTLSPSPHNCGGINTIYSINAGRCCVTFGCQATEGACLLHLAPHFLFIRIFWHLRKHTLTALEIFAALAMLVHLQPVWPVELCFRRCSPEACEHTRIAIRRIQQIVIPKSLFDN